MDRRVFLGTIAGSLVTAPVTAQTKQTNRTWRIGVLSTADTPEWEALRQGLKALGYVEGGNLTIEYRWHGGNFDRLPALAAELVALNVAAIVTSGPQAARAAKDATATIPIVFVTVAAPGPAADALKLKLQVVEARTADDLEQAFESAVRGRANAMNVYGDSITFLHRTRVADLALKHRLPTLFFLKPNVEAGGLLSYGPSEADMLRRAAISVDKILKGARPADLPVEQPTKFELAINLKTARALGLTIPQSLLARADQVIE